MAAIEQDELARRIDPWLAHMRWRPNYAQWRQQRLEQELHQGETLRLLQDTLAIADFKLPIAAGRAQLHSTASDEQLQQPAISNLQLLDLGCGMGGFAVAAARAGAQVTALDYNRAYCAITELRAARYSLRLPVVAGAGEALPLPDAAYHAVVCMDVLEHVQNPAALLSELGRVLRPGGVVLLTAINRFAFRDPHYHLPLLNWMPRPLAESIITLAGRRKGGAFRDRQRLGAMHYFTWRQLQRLAASHGFTLYDLDERRVARGEVGARKRWRRVARTLGVALPVYRAYRGMWQGTWRLALVRFSR